MPVNSVGSTADFSASVPVQVVQIRVEFLPPATQTSVSSAGDLLSRLDALSKSDPEKFKAVMVEVARRLRERTAQAPGKQADLLGWLAARFEAVAQRGDLATLWKDPRQPAQPAEKPVAAADAGAAAVAGPGSPTSGQAAPTTSSATPNATTTPNATPTPIPTQVATSATGTQVARRRHHHHRHHEGEEEQGRQGHGPGSLLRLVADVIRAALEVVLGSKPAQPAPTTATGAEASAAADPRGAPVA
jgi:hypothetical protein